MKIKRKKNSKKRRLIFSQIFVRNFSQTVEVISYSQWSLKKQPTTNKHKQSTNKQKQTKPPTSTNKKQIKPQTKKKPKTTKK